MLQRLLMLVLVFLAATTLRRLFSQRGTPTAQPGRPDSGPRGANVPPRDNSADDRMVRDRVCNTFLPASKALTVRQAGEVHYFCSETCRSRFLGSEPGAAKAGVR